jgi:hypothetical protein
MQPNPGTIRRQRCDDFLKCEQSRFPRRFVMTHRAILVQRSPKVSFKDHGVDPYQLAQRFEAGKFRLCFHPRFRNACTGMPDRTRA